MAKSKKITKKAQTAPKISLKPSVKSTPFAAATKAASKVEETVKTMFKSVPKPEQMFDIEQIKTQMEKFGPSVFKGYEDITSLGKDNVEAAVKSSQIIAKAAEELSKAIVSFTQASLEMGMQASQSLLAVKTVQDLVEAQSEFAKNSFDHVVAGTSKISDMAIKVANEAAEPISQRVNVAIEKITKAA
jgi:phasin family protein